METQFHHFVSGHTIYSRTHGKYPIYRPNGMDVWVMTCTLYGKVRINRGERSFTAERGDILLWPPGVPHDYITEESADDWIHNWVSFGSQSRFAGLVNWPEIRDGVLGFRVSNEDAYQEMENIMEKMVETYRLQVPRKHELCLNLLERFLLLADIENPLSPGAIDMRIKTAIDYINNNYNKPLKVEGMAKKCGMSISRFAHLFSTLTGMSPIRYLEKIRIETAQTLLIGSNMPLSEIAVRTGYSDEYYFSKVFKKLTGKAPGAYRRISYKPQIEDNTNA